MGRAPCCDEEGIKKGPWTPEEDEKLLNYIQRNGHGSWRALPKLAGLNRCGKSCRLRWTNYLRPDIKRGDFSDEEEKIIIKLHSHLGNKWSAMATRLPGRTDNEIKNYWNTHLKKKLLQMGIDPVTHKPRTDLNLFASLTHLLAASNSNLINPWNTALMLQADTAHLARIQMLQILLQTMNGSIPPNMEAPSFHEYHFNKLLQSNGHSVELFDCSLGVGHDPSPFHSNFSNLGINQPPYGGYQALEESCLSLEGQQTAAEINELATMPHFDMNNGTSNNNHHQMSTSSTIAPTIPHTTLVSSSFELVDVDALQDQANPTEISTHSSTSTAFEAWGEFNLDDQASDYCLDIIDQTSLPSWPKESYSNFQMM